MKTFLKSQRGMIQRGFTLLLAALIGSIVLSVGAAMYSIAQKQITLSGVGRDSQYAFYAADSGLECAQYWDQTPPSNSAGEDYSYFGTTTPYTGGSTSQTYTAQCDGQTIALLAPGRPASYPEWGVTAPPSYTVNFFFNVLDDSAIPQPKYCAQVSVQKTLVKEVNPVTLLTDVTFNSRIHSDGYSAPCDTTPGPTYGTVKTGPRILQRSSEACFGYNTLPTDFCYGN